MNNEELVFEFLSDYFGDELNENFSDDDIIDAIYTINELCSAVNEYFNVNEIALAAQSKPGGVEPIPDFSSPQFGHRYNKALKDKDDWPPRDAATFSAMMKKWKTSQDGKQPTHLAKIKTR